MTGLSYRPAWTERALCAQIGGDLWFAEKGDWYAVVNAKLTCFRCPVRRECLLFALENNERVGVWGGLSPKQRDELRKRPRAEWERRGLAS